MTSANAPLPVTVIGGYLGSGKTTLVNHLLRHADGVRLAILVNEFGELAIDEDLIEAEGDDIISIAGGCVCCSFGSDLTAALMDMAKLVPRPDHILIESSGVAIPGAIVASLGLMSGFSADGIVVLADCETVQAHARDEYMGDTITRQLADADIIVLNKADLVDGADFARTREWLAADYGQARVVRASHGIVPPETVLESFLGRSHSAGPHHEAANLDMHTLRPKGPVDVGALAKALAEDQAGIIRAKGFARSLSGEKTLIQVVGRRWTISATSEDHADGIVCLGFKGALHHHQLQDLLAGLTGAN